MGQRHQPDEVAVRLGQQHPEPLPASRRRRLAPDRQVERRPVGLRRHERRDPRTFGRIVQSRLPDGRDHSAPARSATIASARPQSWFAISRRSLPAIAPSRV